MNKFLAVHLKSEWARRNFLEKLAKSYDAAVQFKPKLTAVHMLSTDKLLLSLQADDFFGFGKNYFIEEQKATVFDGFPLPDGRPLDAGKGAQTLQLWLSHSASINSSFERLRGEFSVATYTSSSNEITAFSDYTGLKPLFYIDNNDFSAVSNRQFLLNPICTQSYKPLFDLPQASSLITQGNKFGSQSIFDGVHLLPPGNFLRICSKGDIVITPFSSQLWDDRPIPSSSDYDDACDALVDNFNWIRDVPALNDKPIRLSLTGGEDSRLVLAMGLNSNIRSRITTFTYGQADNPDIKAAEIVASAVKVPHEKKIFASQAPGPVDINGYWNGLSKHAFRFEGATGAWDGGWAKASKMNFDITGFSDFFFKRIRPSNAAVDIRSRAQASEHLLEFQQPYDPLDLVRSLPRQYESSQIQEWIDAKLSAGAALNELPELYYQDNRFTWWSGALNSNVLTQVRVSPMSSKLAAAIGLKQNLKDRRDRKFIFEMMKRLSPELLEIPYLNKQWPEHFAASSPSIKLPGTQFNFESSQGTSQPWQVLLAKHGNKRIKEYLLENERTGIFDLINKQRVSEILDNPGLLKTTPAIRSIINLTELMILLTGEWTNDKDDIEDQFVTKTALETNIPEFKKMYEFFSSGHQPSTIKQKKHTCEINMPKGKIYNIRIDPLDKPGNCTFHKAHIIDAALNIDIKLPLINSVHPNNQLKLTANAESLVMISSGNDPHFAFSQAIFSDLPSLQNAKLIIELTTPENSLVEVFFDTGSGFSRHDMYSQRI
ncbi:asparagine synthase-related protein [Pseudomonas sp. 51_B]|uniref:asparagine synthase-related protein n=1 Tax=Pseudomonas sp. 51_B TaxID=2813573 RepID=UPI001A9E9B23|nr:asparagine synthase-related protein [Pseudomonas sp. 51_B]